MKVTLKPAVLIRLFCILIFLPAWLNAYAQTANIIRGPYIQMGTQNSMIVRWDTDKPTQSYVRFGATVGALNQSESDTSAKTKHIVLLKNLSPSTRYYYSVGTESTAIAGGDSETFFKTSPTSGEAAATRIWVVGDPGRAGTNPSTLDQQYVLNGFKTYNNNRHTDFWLMLGDNAYNDGTIEEYQNAVFNQYPELLKQSVLWPAMGNHDNRSADVDTQIGGYYDLFSTPALGEAGGEPSGHKAYFSFDYGNIHVVVLNSSDSEHNQLSGPMDEWLEQDLSGSIAQWVIAIFHHAPYGKSGHDSDIESGLIRMRENFLPILEKHGVDLVMAGHNHFYTRTKLIAKHYGKSQTFDTASHVLNAGDGKVDGDGPYTKKARAPYSGTVYITHGAGSGGGNSHARLVTQADIDSGKRHPSDYIYGGRGSMVIDVVDDKMKVNVISPNGEVLDHFTVAHQDNTENQPPEALITGPTSAKSNTLINFSAADSKDSDGTITNYLWDFGDNTQSTDRTPAHTYLVDGTYTIKLTVTDNGGLSDTTQTQITITTANSVLTNGQVVMVSGQQKESTYFTLNVPNNAKDLTMSISGGSGDADLYVRFADKPDTSLFDCRPYKGGNEETCNISTVEQGVYHVMLYGYNDFKDVSLTASYTISDVPSGDAIPDACSTQAPISEGRLRDGEIHCLGAEQTLWFTIGKVNEHQSIAISTGHGSGDLNLEFSNQGWPNGDNVDASSATTGNNECIWLKELDNYWGYLKVTGSNGTATITVDFDTPSCRLK